MILAEESWDQMIKRPHIKAIRRMTTQSVSKNEIIAAKIHCANKKQMR
ncbi:MAG: hypothetical protein IJQ75_04155 [Synergistaceae bacterium]|nr:hypothetical protein [Synergistaceae bacterium]MBR0279155.1 hypothetical protein [Synergistaceae bacterium]